MTETGDDNMGQLSSASPTGDTVTDSRWAYRPQHNFLQPEPHPQFDDGTAQDDMPDSTTCDWNILEFLVEALGSLS